MRFSAHTAIRVLRLIGQKLCTPFDLLVAYCILCDWPVGSKDLWPEYDQVMRELAELEPKHTSRHSEVRDDGLRDRHATHGIVVPRDEQLAVCARNISERNA